MFTALSGGKSLEQTSFASYEATYQIAQSKRKKKQITAERATNYEFAMMSCL